MPSKKILTHKKKYAPLWRRVLAYFIDTIVITIIVYPLYQFTENRPSIFKISMMTSEMILATIIIAVLIILYFVIMEYFLGQTIGKMLLKIKVISFIKQLTFKQCLIRNLSKFSSFLLLLDSLFFLKTIHYRYLELISQTEVIRKE